VTLLPESGTARYYADRGEFCIRDPVVSLQYGGGLTKYPTMLRCRRARYVHTESCTMTADIGFVSRPTDNGYLG
jgi:hypothetical protein